ncbi:hypothetical protein SNEBB_000404 [Seison nebaliae]|nr:hypothetical protein SNEBB_000404 [Seison nebaliae]
MFFTQNNAFEYKNPLDKHTFQALMRKLTVENYQGFTFQEVKPANLADLSSINLEKRIVYHATHKKAFMVTKMETTNVVLSFVQKAGKSFEKDLRSAIDNIQYTEKVSSDVYGDLAYQIIMSPEFSSFSKLLLKLHKLDVNGEQMKISLFENFDIKVKRKESPEKPKTGNSPELKLLPVTEQEGDSTVPAEDPKVEAVVEWKSLILELKFQFKVEDYQISDWETTNNVKKGRSLQFGAEDVNSRYLSSQLLFPEAESRQLFNGALMAAFKDRYVSTDSMTSLPQGIVRNKYYVINPLLADALSATEIDVLMDPGFFSFAEQPNSMKESCAKNKIEYIIYPSVILNHWELRIYSCKEKRFWGMNSARGVGNADKPAWLAIEIVAGVKKPSNPKKTIMIPVPQQTDSTSCGRYVAAFIRAILSEISVEMITPSYIHPDLSLLMATLVPYGHYSNNTELFSIRRYMKEHPPTDFLYEVGVHFEI